MSASAPLPALPMPRGVRQASMISASAMIVCPSMFFSMRKIKADLARAVQTGIGLTAPHDRSIG